MSWQQNVVLISCTRQAISRIYLCGVNHFTLSKPYPIKFCLSLSYTSCLPTNNSFISLVSLISMPCYKALMVFYSDSAYFHFSLFPVMGGKNANCK